MLEATITEDRKPQRFTPDVRRGLLSLGLGNTLEWYDWIVFGLLSAFVGPSFFPSEDPTAATLSALAIFAVGFVFRPLGGMMLGVVADRIGRRRVMLLSVSMMAATTLVIAVAPTYAQIGLWAPAILLLCRIVQGVSTGIEAPLSTAHAVELVPDGREGRVAGIISSFVNMGILLASLVTFLTTLILADATMSEWGWRIPFAIGAVMGVVVIYLRRTLPETMTREELTQSSSKPVWSNLRRYWLNILAIIFVVGAVQAYNYAWVVGLPSKARGNFQEDPSAIFALTTVMAVFMVVGSLVVGKLVDGKALSRWFLTTRLLAIPSAFLMLFYTEPGIGGFAAVLLGGAVVLLLNMTLYNVVTTSLVPKSCRGAGTAMGYGIGVAVFGGTASYLLVWLETIDLSWIFPFYISILCLLSIVFYLLARRTNGTFVGK